MKATAKDLRTNAKEIFETVERGEQITLTYRGKDIAIIVPIQKIRPKVADSQLFGMWKDHDLTEKVDLFVRKLRKNRDFDAN